MIKRDWNWIYASGALSGTLTPTDSLSFRSRLKARYYKLNSNKLCYGWKRPQEETLGPTILTTWSK